MADMMCNEDVVFAFENTAPGDWTDGTFSAPRDGVTFLTHPQLEAPSGKKVARSMSATWTPANECPILEWAAVGVGGTAVLWPTSPQTSSEGNQVMRENNTGFCAGTYGSSTVCECTITIDDPGQDQAECE